MKKELKLMTVFLLVAVLLCGCTYQPKFRQPMENIMKIDLVHNTAQGQEILHTITGDDIPRFMADLLELGYHKCSHPQGDPGEWEVWIYYSDTEVDIEGTKTNQYIENGQWHVNGWYSYSEEDLLELFDLYIPKSPAASHSGQTFVHS